MAGIVSPSVGHIGLPAIRVSAFGTRHAKWQCMQQRRHAKSDFLCSELVTVKFFDDSERHQVVSANLDEISQTSMTLLIDSAISTGTAVSIEVQGHTLRGRTTRAEHDNAWLVPRHETFCAQHVDARIVRP
jgi:hypothetical protein